VISNVLKIGGRKLTGIIGLVLGFGCMILAFMMEKGKLMALLSPTSAVIVFGGTIATLLVSFPIKDVAKLGILFKVAFTNKERDTVKLIIYFKDLAFKTRKNGLLSIEGEISSDSNLDPFIKKGLQMIVDGVEPASVRGILELQTMMMEDRHKAGVEMFGAAGGYSPTMGIIGTVMGLVHVLGDLTDPNSLGPKIATAFIATLYGVAFANLMWLPISSRLKAISKEEITEKELITEAILFIQEGVNPNTIAEKLKSFLDTKQLALYDAEDKKAEV